MNPKPTGMTQFGKNGSTVYQNTPVQEMHLEDPSFDHEDSTKFLGFYIDGLSSLIADITAGKLQSRDLVVLIIHVIHSDWRTGRCRLTISKLSEILERKPVTLYPSIKRLKACKLLVPIKDSRTGEKLYIVSPHLLKIGSAQARGFLLKTYYEAIKSNEPGDNTEDDEL
jgi:hypothetical protein